jgi:H+/gluconate symporter-like permease
VVGLLGILLALALLVWLAFRGWSILLLAPAASILVAAFAGGRLVPYWTQIFMDSAARFVAQFFPIFLLGALFGKLMEDSGSVTAIADFMTKKLGPSRATLTVVLAGALVTYGGVSLFVAFFVLVPMAQAVFRTANIPNRLVPAAIALGTMTFTMSALPGTPAIQNAIPMPFFGTTPLAAPGLGIIAAAIMLAFGLGWLRRAETGAHCKGEGFGVVIPTPSADAAAEDQNVRERATTAREFDPPEVHRGGHSGELPPIVLAIAPLFVVIVVNVLMSLVVLPRLDVSFLAEERWGATSLSAVGGVWAVVSALGAAIATVIAANRRRLPRLRDTMDSGANASVLPVLSVGSLVGFGAVVADVPAFAIVRDWGAVDRRRARRLASRRHEFAFGYHRLRFGWAYHRAGCVGCDLYAHCHSARHRSGAAASDSRNERRHARQLAAKRRGRDSACRVRFNPPRELFRHRDGRHCRPDHRARRSDRARLRIRLVLSL